MKKVILSLSLIISTVVASVAQTIPIIGAVFPGQTKNVLSGTNLTNTTKFVLQNTGNAVLKFSMAANATAQVSANGVSIAANSQMEVTVAQLGGVSAGQFLNVANGDAGGVKLGTYTAAKAGPGGGLGGTCSVIGILQPTWKSDVGANDIYVCPTTTKVGIGTTTPYQKLTVIGDGYLTTDLTVGNDHTVGHDVSVGNNIAVGSNLTAGNNVSATNLFATGGIGIGTTNLHGHKLSINGTMRARELFLEEDNWPDYVFSKEHKLMPLKELEAYVNENHHLPQVPEATQVESNGISIAEMSKIQMQKIEEITIYLFEQNKQIEALKAENAKLSEQVNKLKK